MSSEKICCVPNCGSDKEILHQFPNPNKEPDRFRTWIYNIGGSVLALDNDKIFKRRRVCHLHFEARYHTRSKFLSAAAIPRLCLPDQLFTESITLPALPSTTGVQKTVKVENTSICDDDDDANDDSDTLVESNVCRVCLALDGKMYDLKDIELREMFQNVTGIAVTENNHSILERLCWECAGRLKAAAAFRKKALLSDALLQGLASTGAQIRKNDITLIKENEDYLRSAGSLSVIQVFHSVDIDSETDSIPPLSENNDTEIVQNIVRKDSFKLRTESIIEEDDDRTDVEDESMSEAALETEMEYDQFDHNPNTREEKIRDDKINSADSSPLPGCSHVEPKHPFIRYLKITTSDCEDKIKKHVIKITKRDSISKIVSKHLKELIRSAKPKNVNVKIGGVSKKTSNKKLVKKTEVKANTPTG